VARLDRYILRQVLLPFLTAVLVVVLLVFLFQARRLASAALGLGLTLEDAAVIFGAALPPFLVLAVPIAYLLSVLVGLGRLAQDLEVVALLAAGASPLRIARTPLLLGVLVSLLGLPLAHWAEPRGLQALQRRLVDVGLRNLTGAVRPGTFNEDFSGNAVYARARDAAGDLFDVLLFDERDRARPVLVTAARGRFEVARGGVEFELSQGELHMAQGPTARDDQYDRLGFEGLRIGLDAQDELEKKTRFVSAISMLDSPEMLRMAHQLGEHTAVGRRYEKTYWRRFAIPLMAFVFALLGAATALSGGPRSRARSAILGLLAVLAYYLLSRVGDLLVVKYPGTPFWASFGPVLLMAVFGAVALTRAGARR
jgi:lipopolysaccharide export system permease protein